MKQAERICLQGILNHCYQRSRNGFLLFYSVSDYLVYFTLFCITAVKYGVRVLELCLMPDHIHASVIVNRREDLSAFFSEVSRRYARSNNSVCRTEGSLFESPFGSAPKIGAKKARTNLIYLGNNPVERQLAEKAEDYQWNFLAYARSAHPFSEPLVIRKASWPLRRAIREISSLHKSGQPVSYPLLKRLSEPLDRRETRQLTDWIIQKYNIIDYDAAARCFDGFDRMLEAMHTNTGSEYDLNEIFTGKSDACYARMISKTMQILQIQDIHELFALNEEERLRLFPALLRVKDATPEQVAKFLRIVLKRRDTDREMEIPDSQRHPENQFPHLG